MSLLQSLSRYSKPSSPRSGMSLGPLRRMLPLFLMTFAVVGCSGRRVVFVPESDGIVRLGPDVKGHVYYWDGSNWSRSSSPVVLPEGWYAGSLPEDNP